MAHNRTKQRGVIQIATSVLLAAMGALLSVTGCASDEGSGGGETVGRVQQAIACGIGMPCPEDSECGAWSCSSKLNGMCNVLGGAKDGSACAVKSSGLPGLCVSSICCTGCITENRLTGEVTCHQSGTDPGFCGGEGAACDSCKSSNSCVVGTCEPNRRVCVSDVVPDKEPCVGEPGACWQGKCCTGCIDGSDNCVPGNLVTQCGLSSTNNKLVGCKTCDDMNVCNNDSCVNGVCAAPSPKAGACSDGNVCTVNDQCNAGACSPGALQNCNDNNPCTVDTCDAVKGCAHTAVEAGSSCDNDANKCNGTAKCDGTMCVVTPAVNCNDQEICTTDSCTPATGICVHMNNALDCNDGSLCTQVDKCSGGTCVGSQSPNCDDNEPCTTDSCPDKNGCKNTAKADDAGCDDENGCTTGDKCTAGKCAGVGASCADTNECTKTQCVPAGGCSNPPENNGTPCTFDKCHQNSTCQTGNCAAGDLVDCNDNNDCTTDSCDAATGCKHVNLNAGTCNDGDVCTSGDSCKAGACVGTAVVCQAIDECHTPGKCDATTGQCDDPRAGPNTACDDGNGTCDVDTGKCEPNPIGTGGAGSGGETGTAGEGTGGTVVAMGGETSVPLGGEGNEPGAGGTPGEPSGGKGATTSTGGTDSQNGGEGIDPEHVFVRDPGGCSCSVPSSQGPKALWLVGLALVAAAARRRRSGAASARQRG